MNWFAPSVGFAATSPVKNRGGKNYLPPVHGGGKKFRIKVFLPCLRGRWPVGSEGVILDQHA